MRLDYFLGSYHVFYDRLISAYPSVNAPQIRIIIRGGSRQKNSPGTGTSGDGNCRDGYNFCLY